MFLDAVYPLTSENNRGGASHSELARLFLEAGCRFFQIRAKNLQDRLALSELIDTAAACRAFPQARFVVNDRCDLALASGAYGVHLGQTDLPASTARRLLGSDAIIGVSTHSEEQFVRAIELPVDYIALGPIFASRTKKGEHVPVGVQLLANLAGRTHLPVVAIGGITLERAPELWQAGAASVAVISDILDRPDPGGRLQAYLEAAAHSRG